MIAPSADRLIYLDSSALVKLIVEEPESEVLARHLASDHTPVTSRVAVVEVTRATRIANPGDDVRRETEQLLRSCTLVEVNDSLLRSAAVLASAEVRTLDAIHLASALLVEADELVAYDHRLAAAGAAQGLIVTSPGRRSV